MKEKYWYLPSYERYGASLRDISALLDGKISYAEFVSRQNGWHLPVQHNALQHAAIWLWDRIMVFTIKLSNGMASRLKSGVSYGKRG